MRVCIFCGSRMGLRLAYRKAAEQLGAELGRRGIGLVYGGAQVGLMGVLANAAKAAGCETIGVIPRSMVDRELAHNGLTKLHIVGSMHERKQLMADLADAFVAMPGGMGTWDEFCEILTWAQIGIHSKPCAVLNIDGYYDPFITMMERAVAEGFLRDEHRAMVIVSPTVNELLDRFGGC